MPVGTQATVKALDPDDVRAVGAQIVLANTYHLSLRPGAAIIERAGGLHDFMAWDRPILTDSGGFQVFSLGDRRVIDDDGVTFRSHLDGSLQRFTPESVIALEESFGADIIMPLDECVALPSDDAAIRRALDRTHRWLERALRAKQRTDQALFAIVQGGLDPILRREGARFASALDVPGIAIGGLSVGESKAAMYETLALTTEELSIDRPRYLMGVGSPEDLWACVARGVDLFDCVLPARVARHGGLYTAAGRVSIGNARFRDQFSPIDSECGCPTCRRFTAAYLHHLYRVKELLWYRLGTIHNLWFILRQMETIRAAIIDGTFSTRAAEFAETYRPANRVVARSERAQFVESRARRGRV
jgi:queuine tRNA-ribosyltransferase